MCYQKKELSFLFISWFWPNECIKTLQCLDCQHFSKTTLVIQFLKFLVWICTSSSPISMHAPSYQNWESGGVTENPICFIFCFPGQLSTLQIHDQICNEILDINSLIDLGRFYFSLLKKCEMAGPLSTFFFSFDHKILPHGDKSTGSQAVSFCSTDKVTTQSDIIVQLNHPLMKGLRYWIHKRYFCSEKCERPRAMTILWLFSEVS